MSNTRVLPLSGSAQCQCQTYQCHLRPPLPESPLYYGLWFIIHYLLAFPITTFTSLSVCTLHSSAWMTMSSVNMCWCITTADCFFVLTLNCVWMSDRWASRRKQAANWYCSAKMLSGKNGRRLPMTTSSQCSELCEMLLLIAHIH